MAIAYTVNVDGTRALLRVGNSATQLQVGLTVRPTPPLSITYDIGSLNLTTVTRPNDGSWEHACGLSRAGNDHSVYLNGANRVDNTTNQAIGTVDLIQIGENFISNYRTHVGLLENAAIWNVALTDDEVYALGALHVSPLLIRPQSLICCYVDMGRNVDTTVIDQVGGYHLSTVSGAANMSRSDDNPRTLWRPSRRLFISAGSAAPGMAPPPAARAYQHLLVR